MGLGLSLALAFFFTQGMKNIFGKPRPDLLARCDPDMSRIKEFTVGGFAAELNPLWVLVSPGICRTNMSDEKLKDGFRSFPSGHSSSTSFGKFYCRCSNANGLHSVLVWPPLPFILPLLKVRNLDPLPAAPALLPRPGHHRCP